MAPTKTRTKTSSAKRSASKKTHSGDGRHYELWCIVLIALSLLLGFSLYTNATDTCSEFVRWLLYGLFGWPAKAIPVFTFASGVYIVVKRNYHQFYIKMTLLLLALINLSVIFSIFNYDENGLFNAFQLGSMGFGGGLFGSLIANPCMQVLSVWPCSIIFITTLFILFILITKISPVRILIGFFSGAKQEAKEIRKKESYEMGKRARKALDNGLRPLVMRTVDLPIDDSPGSKKTRRANKKTLKASEEQDTKIPRSDDIYDLDFDIPVFDPIAKKLNESAENETISPEELVDKTAPGPANEPKQNGKQKESLSPQQESELREQLEESAKNLPLPYKFPPTTLLMHSKNKNIDSREELRETAIKLVETLKSFGVDVKLLQVSRGPAVTRYELQPNIGVKVSKITGLADDIALNLAAPAVRIEAPIPGKAAIGVEVPNSEVTSVALRDVLESAEFKNAQSKLSVALGMDIAGKPVVADLAKMPHILIAGATGSGKSVCLNSIITSILFKADPNEVKIVMIDPKVVELGVYNGIPHLLIPVVTDPKKASGALAWAVSEMVRRYNLFAENSVRDLESYNDLLELQGEEKLPQILIIIDELADLMMVAPKEVEDSICRLAQMARAAGMHLVIATQRPSVDVITGIIKANIPSRIAFAVSSHIDSRTILDSAGAEKLLGRGDMLYMPMGASKPIRLQGSFISDKEVERVIEFIKDTSVTSYDEEITEKINSGGMGKEDPGDADELLPKAIELALSAGQISTSMVQRRLGVGYARAGRIIDQMEARGIISGADGSKPRNVLISRKDLE